MADDEKPVNIDWSCCSHDLVETINKKFLDEYGIEVDGVATGDERLLQQLGLVFVKIEKK